MNDVTSLTFKIVIIGDSGVGKSNLMTRYTSDEFSEGSPPTIGVEFMNKSLRVRDQEVRVQIWDTAGQERFRAISRSIYHGAKGAMVVYDVTNEESFKSIHKWLEELRSHVPSHCVIFLIGNKSDLEHLRVVKREDGEKVAQEYQLSFFETSALDRTNVEESFSMLASNVFDAVDSGGSGGTGRKGALPKSGGRVNVGGLEGKSKPSRDDFCAC